MVISVCMLLSLAACQTTSNESNNTNEPTNETTEPTNEENQEQAQSPENSNVILATTTSTQDSGLLDVLIPIFEEQNGYNVKTIAVGTGQALAMGEKGEADVLLTHAPDAEEEIEDKGAVVNRKRVMYNDFIIVGSVADPAGISGLTVDEGFKTIAETESLFVSRGDDSGTHKKELSIWESAGVVPESNDWYLESGQGMGATIQVAAEREGYTLTDRATYLALKPQLDTLEIVIEGDDSLLNIYHVMQVNPEKNELVNSQGAEAFVEFMISAEIQDVISTFGVQEYGEPLFFPDAE